MAGRVIGHPEQASKRTKGRCGRQIRVQEVLKGNGLVKSRLVNKKIKKTGDRKFYLIYFITTTVFDKNRVMLYL